MDWIEQDWEREAQLDIVYAQERQSLIEQEYFEYEKALDKKTKKDENKHNTTPLPGDRKKGVQPRRNISPKIGRRKNRH